MKTQIFALLATTAASMILAAPQAHAAIGYRFLPEQLTAAEIGAMIPASLKIDKSGNYPILDGKCKTDPDACAAPIHYLQMFQQASNDSGVPFLVNGKPLTSVDQLPAFFNGLVEVTPPEGQYRVACIERSATGYVAVASCDHRTFKPGEKVWAYKYVDKATGKTSYVVVLAGYCKNPILGSFDVLVTPSQCAYLKVGTHAGDDLHIAMGTKDAWMDKGKCLGVQMPGQTTFSPLAHTCPEDAKCNDNSGHERETATTISEVGSIVVKDGGVVTIRVPAYFAAQTDKDVVILCDRQASGLKSCGKSIPSSNYVEHQVTSTIKARTAFVAYQGEQKADEPGVVWHWDTPDHPCPMPKS